jgi:hypothetical protein
LIGRQDVSVPVHHSPLPIDPTVDLGHPQDHFMSRATINADGVVFEAHRVGEVAAFDEDSELNLHPSN